MATRYGVGVRNLHSTARPSRNPPHHLSNGRTRPLQAHTRSREYLALCAIHSKKTASSMSIYLNAARAILSLPQEFSSWNEYIVKAQNYGAFFWTDDVEDKCHEFWNEIFAVEGGELEKVVLQRRTYRYRDQSVRIRLSSGRADSAIMMHFLNQLVRADTEFRFCIDSSGSSNRAFMVLPARDWAALETEFGQERVDRRFLKFPENIDKFVLAIMTS